MTYYRQYTPWTPPEDARARKMQADGKSYQQISDALYRTKLAIRFRLRAKPKPVVVPDATDPREVSLRRRLDFRYGPERAASIMACNDPATEADVAAWNRLDNWTERAV